MENTDLTHKKQSAENNPDSFVLIIGAMKSGTTSLFEILRQHPGICPSRLKEPDYFVEDRDDNACEEYLALWNWKDNIHTIALESSVAYTKAPLIVGVPERIARMELGKYRFIYMLRDPLSRIESQVRHGLFAGWGRSLDAGIPEDLIDFSRYAMQLDNYLEYFSKDDIILITLEEFKDYPYAVLARICEFLKIDSKFQFSDVEEPRNSGEFFNASPGIARITQGGVGQFLAHRILSPKIKSWLRSAIAKLSKGQKKNSNLGRWRLTPEERILVLDKLKDDLRRLESDFGVDTRKYWQISSQSLDRN